mgnify:FL=1
MAIWIILILVILIAIFFAFQYNALIRLRNGVDNSWAHVDVQLRRRYDLIPNLVETVKGYAAHEKEALESVVQARNAAVAAESVTTQAETENMLTGALRQVFALAESYPELKASENFSQLQEDLAETEDLVAYARQHYNDIVLKLNNKVETLPSNIVASIFNFEKRDYFEIEGEARGPVDIQF